MLEVTGRERRGPSPPLDVPFYTAFLTNLLSTTASSFASSDFNVEGGGALSIYVLDPRGQNGSFASTNREFTGTASV